MLEKAVWELYDLTEDFSQMHDLASEQPERLAKMKKLFLAQAKENKVFPIGAGIWLRIHPEDRIKSPYTSWTFDGTTTRMPEFTAPALGSHNNTVTIDPECGADHGVDGKILFRDDPKAAKPEQIIIQVKGGKTGVKDVRDLRGVLDREKAAIGILISLQPPTDLVETEAASVGFYEHKTNQQKFPRLQLRTVKELMAGKGIERPTSAASLDDTFKKAPASRKKHGEQKELKM